MKVECAQFINDIIQIKRFNSYLEIGCEFNRTFNKINISNKIGVDPVQGGTLRMTSDKFFSTYRRGCIDIIFIDGLHERSQVKKDILNGLNILSERGVIVIHDCLPETIENQFTIEEFREYHHKEPPAGLEWTGDVWKGIVDLRTELFPDICVLDEDWGLGLVKERSNSQIIENVPEELDWDMYCNHKKEMLRVVGIVEAFNFIGIQLR